MDISWYHDISYFFLNIIDIHGYTLHNYFLIYLNVPTGNDFSFRTSVDRQATRFPSWRSAARGPVPPPDPSPGWWSPNGFWWLEVEQNRVQSLEKNMVGWMDTKHMFLMFFDCFDNWKTSWWSLEILMFHNWTHKKYQQISITWGWI